MPMSMKETNMTTNWSENIQGAEQMALSDFVSQLEAHVALDNSKSNAKKEDIREEAEILLSLLSAAPSSQNASIDEDECVTEYQEEGELIRRAPSFSFTCPLMSLDQRSHQDSFETQESLDDTTTTEGSDSSLTATTPVPAILMGRKLKGDGSCEDTEKSGDTIARNIAESFHKAVEWRIQTWIHSLSSVLIQREKSLLEAHASDDIIRELLDTAEARLLLGLQEALSDIKVVDTKTSLNVRPQRINRNQEKHGVAPALKKRKVTDLLLTESEYKYTVAHVLSFESTMNLKTPAGYTEVIIEAPGFIEGTFLSSGMGEDILTGISVEVDTNVIAKAIERSSRIVARTATHAIIAPDDDDESEEEEEDFPMKQTEEFTATSPTLLHANTSPTLDKEATEAVLVTPHKTASSTLYDVIGGSPLLPDDLDNVAKDVIRMVSPQPRSPDYMSFKFTPRTPQTTEKPEAFPSLVSPPPPPSNLLTPPTPSSSKASSEDEESPSLSARKSPSLPALLQAASQAMQEAC